MKPPNFVLEFQWVVLAWKILDIEFIRKSFDICGITINDADKIHFLREGLPTKKARVFLKESDGIIECEQRSTLDDEMRDEILFYHLEEVNDLTDNMLEGFE